MFDIPLATANFIYSTANILVITGAVFMAGGALAAYWSGGVRENYANERVATLENEAEQARLKTARLKQQLAWRELTPEDRAKLEQILSPNPGSVTIKYVATDIEATYFAIQIGNLFERAKWQVSVQSLTYSGTMVFGLWIPGDTPEVRLVRDAFLAIGTSFSTDDPPTKSAVIKFGGGSKTAAVVFVGSKPPPQ